MTWALSAAGTAWGAGLGECTGTTDPAAAWPVPSVAALSESAAAGLGVTGAALEAEPGFVDSGAAAAPVEGPDAGTEGPFDGLGVVAAAAEVGCGFVETSAALAPV